VTPAIDVDAYLERIGHSGGRTPTLDTLRSIHVRHAQAIPFENLNPLLGRPVRLDAHSLQQKLVFGGRGGYCFEQNLLLSHALKGLGFRVVELAARVLWNTPPGVVRPRSHMLLLVDLEGGPYIADVGFGGLTLTGPLRLQTDIDQATPHEPFRLIPPSPGFGAAGLSGQEFVLQALIGDAWRPLYCFGLQEQLLPDYEVTSWYLSNHPESQFVTALMAARAEPDRRYALRNNQLAVYHRDGRTEQRVLTSAAEMRETLERLFQVRLPDAPELDAILTRLIAQPAAIA